MRSMTSYSTKFDYALMYVRDTFRCFFDIYAPSGVPFSSDSTDTALYVWGSHVLFKFHRGLLLSLAPLERRSRRSHSSHSV